MNSLLSTAEDAVRYGEHLGASEVEAYATLVNRKSIVLTKEIEALHTSYTGGLGVRIVVGKKIGFFATSSLTIKDLRKSVEKAYSIASLSKPDPDWLSLPLKVGRAIVEGLFDKKIVELEPDTLIEKAIQLTDAINNTKVGLSITGGDITAEIEETSLANSHGCNLSRKETFASASVTVKTEVGGVKGVSNESQQKRSWKELDCFYIAQKAAERASKIVFAKPISGGQFPVVWCNKLFASILRIMLGGTLSAESVQKGRSPWAGKVGTPIASETVHLIDDGLLQAGIGTREFDDDGISQQQVPLIDHGVLRGFLYDNYTANKAGHNSTGNSSRDYRSLPTPQPNNLFLNPTNIKEAELLEDVTSGLYIIETIGEWLSNPISGDLSATVTNAFLIEKGELTKPVKGIIVSGNFFDLLQNKVDLIANDIQNSGSTYSPSVRVRDMTVTSQ